MPKVEFDIDTTLSAGRVRAALLDFSERRPQIWPGIEPSLYRVYEVGTTTALIQEGSKAPGARVWAKEKYDWSSPDVVTWTVQESNFCAPGSYVSARITPKEDGGSRIHITWNRTPTSLTGKIAAFFIVATKGKPVAASFNMGLARIAQGA